MTILENVLGVTVSVEYFNALYTDGWAQTLVFFVKNHVENYFKNGKDKTNTLQAKNPWNTHLRHD